MTVKTPPWLVSAGKAAVLDGVACDFQRFERQMPYGVIKTSPEVLASCEDCNGYDKNYACPPHSPRLEEYVGNCTEVLVISVKLLLAPFSGDTPQARYHNCFDGARELLLKELYKWREKGKLVGGSGPCIGCGNCTLPDGEKECCTPKKRVFSLEAMGVNVIDLLQDAFEQELEWAGEGGEQVSISAIGAVFL